MPYPRYLRHTSISASPRSNTASVQAWLLGWGGNHKDQLAPFLHLLDISHSHQSPYRFHWCQNSMAQIIFLWLGLAKVKRQSLEELQFCHFPNHGTQPTIFFGIGLGTKSAGLRLISKSSAKARCLNMSEGSFSSGKILSKSIATCQHHHLAKELSLLYKRFVWAMALRNAQRLHSTKRLLYRHSKQTFSTRQLTTAIQKHEWGSPTRHIRILLTRWFLPAWVTHFSDWSELWTHVHDGFNSCWCSCDWAWASCEVAN